MEENARKEENGSASVVKDVNDVDKLEPEVSVKNEAVSDDVKPMTETAEVKDIKLDDKVVEQIEESVTNEPETKIEEILEVQEV